MPNTKHPKKPQFKKRATRENKREEQINVPYAGNANPAPVSIVGEGAIELSWAATINAQISAIAMAMRICIEEVPKCAILGVFSGLER